MKSIGEQRVRIDFNVSGSGDVDIIKKRTADLINFCQGKMDEPFNVELCDERNELYKLAQRAYEEAAMWAVKAATINSPTQTKELDSFYQVIDKLYKKKLFTDTIGHDLLKSLIKYLPFSDVKSIKLVSPTYVDSNGTINLVESIKFTENTLLNENIEVYDISVERLTSLPSFDLSYGFVLRCSPNSIKK